MLVISLPAVVAKEKEGVVVEPKFKGAVDTLVPKLELTDIGAVAPKFNPVDAVVDPKVGVVDAAVALKFMPEGADFFISKLTPVEETFRVGLAPKPNPDEVDDAIKFEEVEVIGTADPNKFAVGLFEILASPAPLPKERPAEAEKRNKHSLSNNIIVKLTC